MLHLIAMKTVWDYPADVQQSDHVDKKLLRSTDGGGQMERVKEKMEQARQQRKILQKNPQAQTNYIQTNRDSTSNQAKSN
jgi:hypothetical protein